VKQQDSQRPDIRFCEKKDMAGVTADGGFAEYVVADADTTVLLPEGLEFEQAAPLMCAGVRLILSMFLFHETNGADMK
jgi:D-arabinose 1-dehydrogenase-like Zn-dependent alcohol dehydrogenase